MTIDPSRKQESKTPEPAAAPGIYALAEEYLRARRTIDALLPASGVMNVDEAIAEWGDFEEGTAR